MWCRHGHQLTSHVEHGLSSLDHVGEDGALAERRRSDGMPRVEEAQVQRIHVASERRIGVREAGQLMSRDRGDGSLLVQRGASLLGLDDRAGGHRHESLASRVRAEVGPAHQQRKLVDNSRHVRLGPREHELVLHLRTSLQPGERVRLLCPPPDPEGSAELPIQTHGAGQEAAKLTLRESSSAEISLLLHRDELHDQHLATRRITVLLRAPGHPRGLRVALLDLVEAASGQHRMVDRR